MRVFLLLGCAVALAGSPANAQAPAPAKDVATTASNEDPVDPRAVEALVEYFAPLKTWLDQQNRGKPSGW